MINPSKKGWLPKLLMLFESQPVFCQDWTEWYDLLRKSGLVYGFPVDIHFLKVQTYGEFTTEEKCKILLVFALKNLWIWNNSTISFEQSLGNWLGISDAGKSEQEFWHALEKGLHQKVQTNQDLLSKNFSENITNSLLFIDVLSYGGFLTQNEFHAFKYRQYLEHKIFVQTKRFIESKEKNSELDKKIWKLLKNSTKLLPNEVVYMEVFFEDGYISQLEKLYLLDLECMTALSDKKLDEEELVYLREYIHTWQLTEEELQHSLSTLLIFIQKNESRIPFLQNSNPVKHFYHHTSEYVLSILNKNKERIWKELKDSKTLMKLLVYSTQRDLTKEEKKRMKEEVLDLCKSIPSLAIFILPGGGLLLPILTQWIPNLLPSSFNENQIDQKSN